MDFRRLLLDDALMRQTVAGALHPWAVLRILFTGRTNEGVSFASTNGNFKLLKAFFAVASVKYKLLYPKATRSRI